DPEAVVQQEHIEAVVAAAELGRERPPRRNELVEHVVWEWPRGAARGVDRNPAPAVDRELDVPAGNAFAAEWFLRAHELDIWASGGNKWQVLVVVAHRTHDNRPKSLAVAGADALAGVKNDPRPGKERVDLIEDHPVAL